MKVHIFVILLFLLFSNYGWAQSDIKDTSALNQREELNKGIDSITDSIVSGHKKEKWDIIPKKSALYAAVIPGLGQIYNRQYWKLPIVYAGVGVAAYLIIDNTKKYNSFRQEFAGRQSGDPDFVSKYPQYNSLTQIQNAMEGYRKQIDQYMLFSVAGYALQVIDALAAGHLRNFDISPDISFRIQPVTTPQGGLGLGLVMNF